MEEDAKSKLSDIDKLRMILDNPEDKKLKNTVSKDKNLDSIRRRLQGEETTQESSPIKPPEVILQKATPLTPRHNS